MKRFLALLILCSYALTFVSANAAYSGESVAKLKITHSHAHGDDHQHEEIPNKDEKSPKGTTQPHGSSSHSHEVLVAGHAVCMSSEVVLTAVRIVDLQIKFFISDESPPKSPALFEIFRPPIV